MNSKNIFLFDGWGAALSVFMHGMVLPFLSEYIGLPKSVHYLLALFPFIYLCNSFFCYFKVNHNKPIWLQIVISGNLLYCLITSCVIIKYWPSLKNYGFIYFLLDYLAIFFVVYIEFRVLLKLKK